MFFLYVFFLKGVCIPTQPTSQIIFLTGGRVGHIEWALFRFKLDTFGLHWTLQQFIFRHISYSLEIIMTSIAKMGGIKTKRYPHRTAVSYLYLGPKSNK